MDRLPLPAVPWQLTGNHWLAIPCLHPGDAAIHRLGVLHRGARAALEFTGAAGDGREAAPLLRPVLTVDGAATRLGADGIAWERALGWLPTFTCTVGALLVRGMLFCPFGRDADMAGAVYTMSIENRGTVARTLDLGLEALPGVLVPRVRTPRPAVGALRAAIEGDLVVLDPGLVPGLASLALGADGEADVRLDAAGTARVTRTIVLRPGERSEVAFYVAAGPERDGAIATSAAMRRRGWQWLLAATRDAIETLQQATGSESLDRLVNRNLLFAYFYGVGRALDDAHFYLVRSRAPWHPAGVTVRDWDALMMTLPAVQLADSGLARELLLRMCELHGYAPGRGVHYFDGTMFEPAYSLDGVAAYAIALERYIRQTNDDHLIDDPVVGDTLYAVHDELADRRHPATCRTRRRCARRWTARSRGARGARRSTGPRSISRGASRPRTTPSAQRPGSRSTRSFAATTRPTSGRRARSARRRIRRWPPCAPGSSAPTAPRRSSGSGAPLSMGAWPPSGSTATAARWPTGATPPSRGCSRRPSGTRCGRPGRRGRRRTDRALAGAARDAYFFGSRGNSSVGRAQPCQGWGRGFESRFPLCEDRREWRCATPVFRCTGSGAANGGPRRLVCPGGEIGETRRT